MAELQFKQYQPFKRGNASRISDEEWQLYHETIRIMHTAGYTRSQMLNHLAATRSFYPTSGQLNARLKVWGFKVYKVPAPSTGHATTSIDSPVQSICVSAPLVTESYVSATSNNVLSSTNQQNTVEEDESSSIVHAAADESQQETAPPRPEPTPDRPDGLVSISASLPPVVIHQDSDPSPAAKHASPHNLDFADCSSNSWTSSMRSFGKLAYRIKADMMTSKECNLDGKSSSAMSIDSRESCKFAYVTGMSMGSSNAMSVDSRKSQRLTRSLDVSKMVVELHHNNSDTAIITDKPYMRSDASERHRDKYLQRFYLEPNRHENGYVYNYPRHRIWEEQSIWEDGREREQQMKHDLEGIHDKQFGREQAGPSDQMDIVQVRARFEDIGQRERAYQAARERIMGPLEREIQAASEEIIEQRERDFQATRERISRNENKSSRNQSTQHSVKPGE